MKAESQSVAPKGRTNRDAERAARRLLSDYAACLDQREFDDWLALFVDPCLYKIISAENVRRNLPQPLMYCKSKGMLRDRLAALKDITVYNPHTTRHLITDIRVDDAGSGLLVRSNFAVFQTTPEGTTSLFMVGGYEDRVVETASGLRFQEKIAIVDTFNVRNLLAVPL